MASPQFDALVAESQRAVELGDMDLATAIMRKADAMQSASDPTEGMSGFQRFAAGMGKGMNDLGRGVGQLVGAIPQSEIAEAAARDEPLMSTGAGAAGNLAGAISLLAPTALIPGANTLAGAGAIGALSGLASPVTEGNVAAGKLKSAGIGGLLGPAALLAGRGVHAGLNAASGLLEPFRAKGQEAIVGRILNRFATQSDDAARAAGSARSPVAGYQQTLAEATQDPGLATLQRAVMNTDAAAQIGAVERQNAGTLKGLLSDLAGDEGRMTAAKGARQQATDALYSTADESVLPVGKSFKQLLRRPVVREALSAAKVNAANRGGSILLDLGNKTQGITGRSLHQIKKALDDAYEAATPKSEARNAIGQARADVLEWIETRVPEYGEARETFAALSRPINQMEVGGLLSAKLSPSLDDFAETGGLRAAGFAQSLRNPDALVRQAIGHSGKLDEVLDPGQLGMIEGVGQALAGRASAQNLARPTGTNTAQNLSAQNLMRQIAGPLGLPESFMDAKFWPTALRPAGFMLQAQEPAINQVLANAITDPKLAARLMQAGVPRERVGEVIEQLARYAVMPGLLSANAAEK